METMVSSDNLYSRTLDALEEAGNLRTLSQAEHQGKWIWKDGKRMLNLSSNDYLGLAADTALRDEFMRTLSERDFLFSSSSSRLLTGNFTVYDELEQMLAEMFGAGGALVFSSGYHMNTGILPAVADAHTLILADKLVHASLIDGIRLSAARCIRYRHQDYGQLEALLAKSYKDYERIVIVTESVFSMDGDVAPLDRLVDLKKRYPGVMLYVDEAHGIGVRGKNGLGVAEEQGCLKDIDFLCGTFGKALASVGAHRLDRPVSGLVVFAKTSKALSRLNDMFRNSEVKKTYWAIVKQCPPAEEGELVHYLVRNEKQNKSYAYDKEVKDSKKAILDYKLIGHSQNYYLLEINLKTGRHHQIRCQLTCSPKEGQS